MALGFAVIAPVMLVAAGVAVDYSTVSMLKAKLQSVADAAAIAGAREFSLSGTSSPKVEASVAAFINLQLDTSWGAISHVVAVSEDANEVRVEVAQSWRPMFARFFDETVTPIHISSTARLLASTTKICVLALDPAAVHAIRLDSDAKLTANGCGVYADSTDKEAIRLDANSAMTASLICSAGGVRSLKAGALTPTAVSDCPPVPDPLADRPPPPVGPCDYTDYSIVTGSFTFPAGTVFCGGLRIWGDAQVTFSEGEYVIKDGPFTVADSATVLGVHAGFYLTGVNTKIDFNGDSTINLTGPKTGPLAGLLFFEDRTVAANQMHRISSTHANILVGTIYLSRGKLRVDPNAAVAADSAYTAVVVNTLELDFGLEMILNSDYEATDVPVPAGIRGDAVVVLAN